MSKKRNPNFENISVDNLAGVSLSMIYCSNVKIVKGKNKQNNLVSFKFMPQVSGNKRKNMIIENL